MKLELAPDEEEMLTGIVGEYLADLELSTGARLTLESIYYKLMEEI
jgi:hypothetical protein